MSVHVYTFVITKLPPELVHYIHSYWNPKTSEVYEKIRKIQYQLLEQGMIFNESELIHVDKKSVNKCHASLIGTRYEDDRIFHFEDDELYEYMSTLMKYIPLTLTQKNTPTPSIHSSNGFYRVHNDLHGLLHKCIWFIRSTDNNLSRCNSSFRNSNMVFLIAIIMSGFEYKVEYHTHKYIKKGKKCMDKTMRCYIGAVFDKNILNYLQHIGYINMNNSYKSKKKMPDLGQYNRNFIYSI